MIGRKSNFMIGKCLTSCNDVPPVGRPGTGMNTRKHSPPRTRARRFFARTIPASPTNTRIGSPRALQVVTDLRHRTHDHRVCGEFAVPDRKPRSPMPGGAGQGGVQRISAPPVIGSVTPVMKPAASETRKAAASPMSRGWPMRRTGMALSIFALRSSVPD